LVIAQDISDFNRIYPADSVQALGSFGFGLSSKGERLRLYDKEGFIVDSLTYTEQPVSDSLFTLSLVHPDSSSSSMNAWKIEAPNPSYASKSYRDHLKYLADKAYWTKVFYIGGGGFFFILISGYMWFRYYRKKKRG
jgi:hypothetical protein